MVPVRVPGDGNCMVWSIRVLLMGWDHVEKISHGSKEGREEHNEIRESLKESWEEVAGEPVWQLLFQHFCSQKRCSFPIQPLIHLQGLGAEQSNALTVANLFPLPRMKIQLVQLCVLLEVALRPGLAFWKQSAQIWRTVLLQCTWIPKTRA